MKDDVRFSLRMMRKNPGFTAVAVLTMAFGIGATSAIFSVLNSVLIEPLPYAKPERLVEIWQTRPGTETQGHLSLPDYLDLRAQNSTLSSIAAFNSTSLARTDGQEAENVSAATASYNVFETLGVQPARGRGFRLEEEVDGGGLSAVLSDAYWRRAFGASPDALGSTITLDGRRYTVVGVLPRDFRMPMLSAEPEVWVPLSYKPSEDEDLQRGAHYLYSVGRLVDGTSEAAARAELGAIAGRLASLYPDSNTGRGFGVASLEEQIVGDVRPVLFTLLGAVALVLLIACANVANLLLAKATNRQREVAVRVAMGASRARLVRQFLVESLVLATVGGAIGLALASWGVDTLAAMSAGDLPRSAHTGIDLRVLAVTAGLTLLTGLAFGMAPALQASHVDLNTTLKTGGRGSAGGRHRLRATFVVVQVAMSLVLLVGSGLLLRSLYLLQSVDPGFDPTNVVTMEVSLPESSYDENEKLAAFVDETVERIRTLPGVAHAAAGFPIPYGRNSINLSYTLDDEGATGSGDKRRALWFPVTPGYFEAMGIPLLSGRDIGVDDRATTEPVVVIGQTLARQAFGDADPLGRRITIGYNDMVCRVVGVAGDVRCSDLSAAPEPEMYTPYVQTPWPGVALVARTSEKPEAIASLVRDQIRSIDRNVPVYDVRTMDQRLAGSLERQRFSATLIGLFAALALALAAVGLYGVMAFLVAQRTREFGVLMALGAERRHILRLVVGRGMAMTLAGAAIGIVAAALLTRWLESQLYGVTATDPLAYLAMTAVLAAATVVACYIPARRATRIDPAVALRAE